MTKNKITLFKRLLTVCLSFAMLMIFTDTKSIAAESTETNNTNSIIVTESVLSDINNISDTIIMSNFEPYENIDCVEQPQPLSEEIIKGIIGFDNRKQIISTSNSPERNVCYIKVTFPNGESSRGSGTLVCPNVVLTAGHVLYSHKDGGWATSVEVRPAMIDFQQSPLIATMGTGKMASSGNWINNKDYNYDWGVVQLKRSYDTYQNYGYYKDNSVELGRKVTTYGYPADKGFKMMCCEGTVQSATNTTMNVNNDIVSGDSGGAVIDTELGILVGIISNMHHNGLGIHDYNVMVKINQTIFNAINAVRS